jgi:Family of unknown function (DUF5946)
MATSRFPPLNRHGRSRLWPDPTTLPSAYDELYAYTMGRPGFVLQHVVDAYGAQSATEKDKPIRLVFSLVGLYLRVERGFSGQAVQRVHIQLGKEKAAWPRIALPRDRGPLTPSDVMAAPEGSQRDAAIDAWCQSIWAAFKDCHPIVIGLLRERGIA